jgi:hypothetical protein
LQAALAKRKVFLIAFTSGTARGAGFTIARINQINQASSAAHKNSQDLTRRLNELKCDIGGAPNSQELTTEA